MIEKDLDFNDEVSLTGDSTKAELEYKLEKTTQMLKKISSILNDYGYPEIVVEIDNFLRRMDL